MSLGNPAVECFAVYEPRMMLNNKRYFAVIRGGNQVTPYVFPVTGPSQSSLNFVCNPTSRNVVVDRAAIVNVNSTTTLVGSRAGAQSGVAALIQEAGDIAPRSWPIASVTQTLNSTINGFGVVQQMAQVVHALENFNEFMELKNSWLSFLPQMPDTYQDYRLSRGANNDPLAGYSTNSTQDPRGAYPFNVIANSVTGATLVARFYEWLMIPPWIFDQKQAGGLTNVDTLNFQFNINNLPRMWSIRPPWQGTAGDVTTLTGINLTSASVTIDSANMILFFITPRITDTIPSELVYPYYQIISYRSQQGNAAAIGFNGNQTLVSNPIQFQSIPVGIFYYAKQADSVIFTDSRSMVYYTDSFMKINSFSLNWNNINGIYSGSDVSQLYQTSVLNGLNLSFVEWNGSLTTTDANMVPVVNPPVYYNNSVTDHNIAGTPFGAAITPGVVPLFLKGGIIRLSPGVDIPCRDEFIRLNESVMVC